MASPGAPLSPVCIRSQTSIAFVVHPSKIVLLLRSYTFARKACIPVCCSWHGVTGCAVWTIARVPVIPHPILYIVCDCIRFELAAGATRVQMESLDAELMKMYTRVPVATKGGGKGGAAGKPGGKAAPGAKPPAAVQNGAPAAPQQGAVHVPPAPGTPVSASATPVQRLGAAGRERTPEEARGSGSSASGGKQSPARGAAAAPGGEPAAKRPRTDGSAAPPPAAQQPATAGNGGAAATTTGTSAPPPAAGWSVPNGGSAPAQNGLPRHAPPVNGRGGAPASSSTAVAGQQNGSAPAAIAAPAALSPASIPPGVTVFPPLYCTFSTAMYAATTKYERWLHSSEHRDSLVGPGTGLAAAAPAPAQPGTQTALHCAG